MDRGQNKEFELRGVKHLALVCRGSRGTTSADKVSDAAPKSVTVTRPALLA